MLKFQFLTIHCKNEQEAQNVLSQIVMSCTGEQFRYVERNDIKPYPVEIIRVNLNNLPKAKLFIGLSWSKSSDVNVTNIIPDEKDVFELSKEQYNAILQSFNAYLNKSLHIQTDITKADVSIEELIPTSCNNLKRWYELSNPGGRLIHDSDVELWYIFIFSLIKSREELGMDDFENWLINEKHESYETAEEIVERYGNDKSCMEFCLKYGR